MAPTPKIPEIKGGQVVAARAHILFVRHGSKSSPAPRFKKWRPFCLRPFWPDRIHTSTRLARHAGITSIHASVFKLAFQAATAGFLAYGVESTWPILLLRRRCLLQLVTDEQPLLSQLAREEINLQGFFGHLLSMCLIISSQTAPVCLVVSTIFALAHDISDGQPRSVHHLWSRKLKQKHVKKYFYWIFLGAFAWGGENRWKMKYEDIQEIQELRSQIFWSFLPIRATILK